MKHLLMILDHFPPAFAPRMGYLCKYLKEMDWDAVVLSIPHPTRNAGFEFLEGNVESHLVENDCSRLGNLLYGFAKRRSLWSKTDEQMYRMAKQFTSERHFDAILCSTASFFPLYTASRIAKETGLPLLIDLRDIYEQDDNFFTRNIFSNALHNLQIKKRDKLLTKASAVTTVSSWHKEFLSQFNANTTLIFNGFDEELFLFPQPTETQKFTITYTGSIPSNEKNATRSPELLFQAISELIEQGKIDKESVSIRFFSDSASQSSITHYIKKHKLNNIVETHDWLSAEKIPQILETSNILLLLSSEEKTHGIVTTKLFEYMASNREILCIPNSGGEIEKILTQTKAGCCINSLPELHNYLKFKYNEWQKKHFVEPHTERSIVSAFSRERQAMQFVNILNNIIKTNNL